MTLQVHGAHPSQPPRSLQPSLRRRLAADGTQHAPSSRRLAVNRCSNSCRATAATAGRRGGRGGAGPAAGGGQTGRSGWPRCHCRPSRPETASSGCSGGTGCLECEWGGWWRLCRHRCRRPRQARRPQLHHHRRPLLLPLPEQPAAATPQLRHGSCCWGSTSGGAAIGHPGPCTAISGGRKSVEGRCGGRCGVGGRGGRG